MMRHFVYAHRLYLRVLLLSLVVSLSLPTSTSAQNDMRYFPETGHYIGGFFRFFWETNGGLSVFGFPITEEYVPTSSGLITQYFEHARFELVVRDSQYGVELGSLGRETTGNRIFPKVPPIRNTAARRYFPESQNILQNQFKRFWETQGGERIFGLPISEEITEILPDGAWHTVQYFERARFEYWPALPLRNRILLSHLGRVRAPSDLLDPLPPNARPSAPISFDDLEFISPTLSPTAEPAPVPPPTTEPALSPTTEPAPVPPPTAEPALPPAIEPAPAPPPTAEPALPLPSNRVNVPPPTPVPGTAGSLGKHDREPPTSPKDIPEPGDVGRVSPPLDGNCSVADGTIVPKGDVEVATELVLCPYGFASDRDIQVRVRQNDGTEVERLSIPPDSYWFWPVLPGDSKGVYNINFIQGDKRATVTFTVIPAKTPHMLIWLPDKTGSTSAPRGTTIPIALAGFKPGRLPLYLYSVTHGCLGYCYRYVTRLPDAVIDNSRETIYGLITLPQDPPGQYEIRTDPSKAGLVSFTVTP